MFRNREVGRLTVYFCLITAVATAAGYMICPVAGILLPFPAVVLGILFYRFTKARYRSIAALSEQIDRALHNAGQLCISEEEEGELSILQSEIMKMTLRIREQNDALRREKEHLAESLADISHQLRTPLTSVNIILSLLEKTTGKEETEALIREAEELSGQMDFLLNALLKLSRLDAGIVTFRRERIRVSDLLTASLHPFLIPMELRHIQLRTDIPEEAEISCDPDWMAEAVRNIVKNGMESAGDPGELRIACEDNPLFVEITFRDNGAGFRKEDLPRLFERFYRGKNSDLTGYGIGLALCRTIIMGQGGTVTARNHPHGGAVFTVRFPK